MKEAHIYIILCYNFRMYSKKWNGQDKMGTQKQQQ